MFLPSHLEPVVPGGQHAKTLSGIGIQFAIGSHSEQLLTVPVDENCVLIRYFNYLGCATVTFCHCCDVQKSVV